MIKKLALLFIITSIIPESKGQSTLFDDSRVSSVYIEIPPDSLNFIMKNVLSDHYFGSRFIFDDGSRKDTIEKAGFRLRGNTSRYSKKKSFKISFNEYSQGSRYQGVKKINLNGQHNDPTLIREKLFYDTWKKAGMPERRTSFVRLYINGTYYGLYTNLEEFDKDWLKRVFRDNDGNLFKCTYPADLTYHGDNQQYYKNIASSSTTGGRAYDLQTNQTEDDYSDLVQLTKLLDMQPDSAFAYAISHLLDVDFVLKAFALDVATGNWDDYMYNKNNYFLYHNTETGKFEFISYDTDNTFGVDWMKQDWATRNCLDWYYHNEPRPLASKLLSIPVFFHKYQCFLDTIARRIIEPDSIFPHIDQLEKLITKAAEEDTYRTLDYGYSINAFHNGFTRTVDGHTPYGIKPFLSLRKANILEQLKTSAVPDYLQVNIESVTIFPNPAGDFINLIFSGTGRDLNLSVSDCMGRAHFEREIQGSQNMVKLSLKDLPAGIYILTVKTTKVSFSRKFVRK